MHQQSIRGIAEELHVHRRMVRQALEGAVPPPRKQPKREPVVLTQSFRQIIDQWLLEDRKAPRKQRHTAQRIWERLTEEYEFQGHPSTVRRYVAQRKAVGGHVTAEIFFLCNRAKDQWRTVSGNVG